MRRDLNISFNDYFASPVSLVGVEWGLVGGLPTVGTYVLWVSVGTEATVEPYVRAFLRGKILIFDFYFLLYVHMYVPEKQTGRRTGHASLSAVSLS